MFKEVQVRNFRCFKDLTVKNLSRINLISGPNNIGKTSLLEAFFILQGPYSPDIWFKPNIFRGLGTITISKPLEEIFYEFDIDKKITITSKTEDGKNPSIELSTEASTSKVVLSEDRIEAQNSVLDMEYQLKIEYSAKNLRNKPYIGSLDLSIQDNSMSVELVPRPRKKITDKPSAIFISSTRRYNLTEHAERFGNIEYKGRITDVVNALKIIEPRIKRLTTIVKNKTPIVHAYLVGYDRPIPLQVLGGGLNRLFSYIVDMLVVENGVLFIDEFENGIHHSLIPKIWKYFDKLTKKYNVQIFATTHSIECIRSAKDVFCDTQDDVFKLHRMSKKEDQIYINSYDCKAIKGALDMDLRVR